MEDKRSSNFINRETSLIAFQKRVLSQAENPEIPLLERLSFLCIASKNIDEFFEVRVAGLKEQISAGRETIEGVFIDAWLENISQEIRGIIEKSQKILDELLPLFAQEQIILKNYETLSDKENTWLEHLFINDILPLLTPISLDVAHPFPHVQNKGLNFIIELEGCDVFERPISIAILPIPITLDYIIMIPKEIASVEYTFVNLEDLIRNFVDKIFNGIKVKEIYQFRVTRNSHLFIDDEESKNLRTILQGELEQRHFGKAVRLEIADHCPKHLVSFLKKQFELKEIDLYQVNRNLSLVNFKKLSTLIRKPHLKFPTFVAQYPESWSKTDVFGLIKKQDILLHHPFECFTPVIELLKAAVIDPNVLAIRMTVYRTGTDSMLMQELIKAAKNGKEVNVVVELMARFDEATNLSWANQLENAGAKIVYGIFGLKTHAKMLLIIRKEFDKQNHQSLVYYTHVSTGNYHPKTAKLYTDFGLITANQEIGNDISALFLSLSSLGAPPTLKHIWQAPFNFYTPLLQHINFEMEMAKQGKKATIIAKMNALLEPLVIEALYAASQAGVKIDLIVRGACSLRPNVKGLSENIRVISIVGQFLEHSRIYYFFHNGEEKVYISSADWMNRNLFRRVEIAVPILDKKIKFRIIKEGLKTYLLDNQRAFELNGNDELYHKKNKRSNPHSAQDFLLSTKCK